VIPPRPLTPETPPPDPVDTACRLFDLERYGGVQLGKALTAGGVRQLLHRARDHFAAAVLEEVVHSLETPMQQCLEDELLILGLRDYCRTALQRRGSGGASRVPTSPARVRCGPTAGGKKSEPFL
jgi:hypothetical protein